MSKPHLEFLVEEPSMEAFLRELLPRLLADRASYAVHPHQGKPDLLAKLPGRLRGYAKWLPESCRIVVVVDRDDQDCLELKQSLEDAAAEAGLTTRSAAGGALWQVVNRVAVEELEAWYFGDWEAVRQAYPSVSESIPRQARYRDPDAVTGGTWEAFERILKKAGYFQSGLRKTEAARAVGEYLDASRNASASFVAFRDAVLEAVPCRQVAARA